MYVTSEEYKASLDSGWLDTDISGKITLTNGTIITFAEKDIVPGSLGYTNKALNGNDFCFGGIYVGELTVDLMIAIDRYSLQDAKIEVTYTHRTAGGIVDEIPIGIFYVYEATRTKRIISLKAYDSMINFDKEVEESTTGTLFDILSFIAEKCEVPLAQTEDEINSFVNSEWWLTLDMEQISTYREALSSIGLLCGRFATINRAGQLEFRVFKMRPQDSVSARRRTESTIEDFRTYFYGVKARFLANENYYPYTAVDETMTSGLMLDLGDISIFQGENTSKETIMKNLLEVAKGIKYVPMDLSMISDPSIDLGDCLELTNVNGTEESVITSVHSVAWTYHSKHKLSSFGSNPKLKGIVSKEDRLLAQLEAQLSSKDLVVKTYTNSNKIIVNDQKEQEIFLFNFASTQATTVMFMGTVPYEASLDGNVIIRMYLDGMIDDTATVRQYADRGFNLISLTNYFPMRADGRVTLKITMQAEYFESDARVQQSNIVSMLDYVKNQKVEVDSKGVPYLAKEYVQQKVDTTPLTVSIKKSAIKGLLFAQGIAGAGQWDGTINVTDDFKAIKVGSTFFKVAPMGERFTVKKQKPIVFSLEEKIETLFAGGVEYKVAPMGEKIGITEEDVPTIPITEGFRKVQLDMYFSLNRMKGGIVIATEEEEE